MPTLLYDAACPLCTNAARWIEQRGCVRIRPLKADEPQDAIILHEGAAVMRAASAVLRTCRYLPGKWKLLALLLAVPRPIRDGIYRFIARHRYRLLGRAPGFVEEAQNTGG